MSALTGSTVEESAFKWFGELGYAICQGPEMAPGEAAVDWEMGESVQRRTPVIEDRIKEGRRAC